jgi:hypothetical protein
MKISFQLDSKVVKITVPFYTNLVSQNTAALMILATPDKLISFVVKHFVMFLLSCITLKLGSVQMGHR